MCTKLQYKQDENLENACVLHVEVYAVEVYTVRSILKEGMFLEGSEMLSLYKTWIHINTLEN